MVDLFGGGPALKAASRAAGRRGFDLLLLLLLLPVALPVGALVALAILLADGAPMLIGSERIGRGGAAFRLWTFRTMLPAGDEGVAGADHQAGRVTAIGHLLRRTRLDELPQLWNVLMGDMAVVGPRPPLRRHVERFPERYGRVLHERPGLTGAASQLYRRREKELLASCASAGEAERIFVRRCLPAMTRLELRYARRRTLCTDLVFVARTAFRFSPYRARR